MSMNEGEQYRFLSTGQGIWGQSDKKGHVGKAGKLAHVVATNRKMANV